MKQLRLLVSKDYLLYQITNAKSVLEEKELLLDLESKEQSFLQPIENLLKSSFDKIEVYSAFNHFTLMPEGFSQHEMGLDLLSLNASLEKDEEELMLAVNKKHAVQFYYTFPKDLYQVIKQKNKNAKFNFSGEKFLNQISVKKPREVHINLYQNQCEFFAFANKKVVLYNHLDLQSEVDFLYFILFTLSKIDFSLRETRFHIYGETSQNETFISELNKFATHLKIPFDNLPKKNFILN
ncbi:DUF3822 family protein [Chryseobacterium sp. A301]